MSIARTNLSHYSQVTWNTCLTVRITSPTAQAASCRDGAGVVQARTHLCDAAEGARHELVAAPAA